MLSLEQRSFQQNFWAFGGFEAMPFIWGRVEPLVNSGRRMIYTERWLGQAKRPDTPPPAFRDGPRVVPGLRLQEGGFQPGAYFDKFKGGFSVHLMPGIYGLGMWADSPQETEQQAADRFREQRDGTRIDIQGFGLGREDHIRITHWNNYRVGHEKCLYFEFEESDQRAEREANFLTGMASNGAWEPDDLRTLAERVQYYHEPALDLAAAMRAEKAEP